MEKLNHQAVSYYHDGTIVPELLTDEEAIKFLRLDDGTTEHPLKSLQYYRDESLLKGTRVGKRIRYMRIELIEFLYQATKNTDK